jgi:MoaA/NifB/PqqE/SkfB family radical SAM enzyme
MSYVVRRSMGGGPVPVRRGLLQHLDLELTERCDNDCVHCCVCRPEDDAAAMRWELDTGEIQDVLIEAARLGALTVRFTGGEPLLRDDFEELYVVARRLGLRVMLFTNARRITPALASLFSDVPPLEPVEVSAYGMSEFSYRETSRRSGAFDEFRRGVALLREHNVPFVLKSVLLPGLVPEVDRFREWVTSVLGADERPVFATTLSQRVRTTTPASGGPRVDLRDVRRRNAMIRRVRVEPTLAARVLSASADSRAEMERYCGGVLGPPGDALFSCGAGRGACCVDSYGAVQPCLTLRSPATAMELRSASTSGAERGGWNDGPASRVDASRLRVALSEVFPLALTERATDVAYLERCARCFLKGMCEQCPSLSWAEHATLDTPVEHACALAHACARELGLITAGEVAWGLGDWRERVAGIQVA